MSYLYSMLVGACENEFSVVLIAGMQIGVKFAVVLTVIKILFESIYVHI